MSDSTAGPTVEIRANTGNLEAGMQAAANSVQEGVNSIRGHLDSMNAMFGKLTAGFAMFTAALAGGSALKSFVSDSIESTKAAAVLGKTFGITATEASYFKAALAGVGVSVDTASTAANKITMALLKNEDAFKNLGVATRDSAGHLRNTKDLMLDTNEALRAFKEGTDRNIEGMKIYGRQWAEIAPLVSKFKGETEETRKEAEALNLVVGQEAVSDMANYKVAQIGVHEVMEGIKNTIGREIIPRLVELGNWFKSIGPAAVEVTRVAMQGYLAVQDSLRESVKALWEVAMTAFHAIGDLVHAVFGSGGTGLTAMTVFQNVVKLVQITFIGFRVGVEEACAIIVGAINTIKIIVGGLYDASKSAVEGVLFFLERLGIAFQGVGAVAQAAINMDWSGMKSALVDMSTKLEINARNIASSYSSAKDSLKKIGTDMEANFQDTTAKMVKIAVKGREDIDAAISKDLTKNKPVTAIKAKEGGERSEGAVVDPGKKDRDERMKRWEASLIESKTMYMRENDMRELSLGDEKLYWSRILATLSDGDNVKSAVRKKFAEAEFAELKQQAKNKIELATEEISKTQKLDLMAVDRQQEAAAHRMALGMETQAQMLKQEAAFENARYEINVKALRDRLALLPLDPNNVVERQKILDQLLEMEQKHANDMVKIENKAAQEARKPFTDFMTSSQAAFKQSIASMIDGTQTFSGAMKGLFKGILGAFANMVAEMAIKWIMSMVTTRAVQATTGVAQVMSNAAVAASAAFASIAAIPFIGPALAPGAAAAAYAGTAAWAPLASARDGFDIPAGLNPVTQLHEREMVLPAAQADAVRDMANGNGGGGGVVNLHVNAVDAKSVERLFKENGRHIASALQNQVRNFAVKP